MIVSVDKVNSQVNKYDAIDESLITSRDYVRQFGLPEDYVEYHIYTKAGVLLKSNYNYTGYAIPGTLQGSTETYTNDIEFFPGKVIEDAGYIFGSYTVEFNIFRKKIFNTNQKMFFIKELSNDRTELRVSSNYISNNDIETGVVNFLYEIQTSGYFKDFLLNFGDNKNVNAVNIALDRNTDPYSILIKLYQPLPAEFGEKSSFWIVEELSEASTYQVAVAPTPVEPKIPYLNGPNFDIDVDDKSIPPSEYYNIDTLLSNKSLGSYQELLNVINQKGIQINVNYSDYSQFVHFSSAKERLLNFVYKVGLIEDYQTDIDSIKSTSNYASSSISSGSIISIQAKIDSLIQNFDGYEYYLYYASESAAWPKSNSSKPYTLYNSTSTQVTNWLGSDDYDSALYGGQLYSASIYDLENQDNLAYTIPEYITIDPVNDGYTLFLNMVGQHFDNIWIYIKSITDLNKAKNSLYEGISKDVVYYALRSLGIKLYNSKSNDNIFQYLIGSTPSGSYSPTGSAFDTVVFAVSESVPGQDIQKETLKRIYHNLPLLLKSKGTARGVKALISAFGIPDTILSVNEFGGSDKVNNTVEYSYERFSYSLNASGSYVKNYWGAKYDYPTGSIKAYVPSTIEFRFKPDKTKYNTTASLFDVISSAGTRNLYLTMYPDATKGYPYSIISLGVSGSAGYSYAPVSLPIYMTASSGESLWWNVMVRRARNFDINTNDKNQNYDLFVKNKIGYRIGHQASSSVYALGNVSSSYNYSWNQVTQSFYLNGTGSTFFGNFQELRYWASPLSESVFDFHTLNPESIRGNNLDSAYFELSARYPLGNNLITYNHTLTGSVYSVQPNYKERSFITGSTVKSASFVNFYNEINYDPNEEEYVTDSTNMIYSNPVNHKIRIVENEITGSVLSPFLRMEDETNIYTTKDVHFVDVSFSPQNEINKDIIAQYGSSINIDEYIGDPRNDYDTEYPALVSFNEEYYEKYLRNYNLSDFIRLIKFFDNSLFKMIKDYVPARSSLQTGLTIKSPVLERPKAKRAETTLSENYNSFDEIIQIGDISADSTYTSSYGDGRDFFTGELSGSTLNVNKIFLSKNNNPYLVYTASINDYIFSKSEYNVLLNNVSASQVSNIFRKINPYQPGVLEDMEIEDSKYTDSIYTRPRYDGVKSTSAKYNFYTDGDESYGKNAAIDFNVSKFAFSNNINKTNLNFYDKTTVNLKYLIDASGSITELSRQNNNLFEVQNMFKKGDIVNISLMDTHNPTNQASLEGGKVIYEGGFKFSPILYREDNENLEFTYVEPVQVDSNTFGIRTVHTSSLVWISTQWKSDFRTVPNGSSLTFRISGVSITDPNLRIALTKLDKTAWPYPEIPLQKGHYPLPEGQYRNYKNERFNLDTSYLRDSYTYIYTIDQFLPSSNQTIDGGRVTPDMANTLTVSKSTTGNYTYVTAPRDSTYVVNVDIPIRMRASNPEPLLPPASISIITFGLGNVNLNELGPSIVKVFGIIEVQKNGSSTWDYKNSNGELYGYTEFAPTNVPIATGGVSYSNTKEALVDEKNSFIHFPSYTTDGTYNNTYISPYFEGRCQLFDKKIPLETGDKVRLRFYLAEATPLFYKSTYVYFEVLAGDSATSYFEVYDKTTADTNISTQAIIGTASPLFQVSSDHMSLIFSEEAALLYKKAYFEPTPSDNPAAISNYYSLVEDVFSLQKYDIIRFTSYYSIKPEYYMVMDVAEPVAINNNGARIILKQLTAYLDRKVNEDINPSTFAIFRKKPDETTLLLDFKKRDGMTSNAIVLPYNLESPIQKNLGNIMAPLKNTILSKVLLVN